MANREMNVMDDDELDEVMNEFIIESRDNLDQLDQALVDLETNHDAEVVARIFRTIHTIKGTAGFLGFDRLGQLTHAGENLLSRLRNGELTLNQPRTNALLSLVDAVREMLAAIEAQGAEGGEAHDAVMAALNAALLDGRQHLAHGIDQRQQRVRPRLVEREVAVAQPAQQVLAGVRELTQTIEAQEACGPLDRVDGSEDAREHLGRARISLELEELVVEPVEVLVALQEELLDDLIDLVRVH